MAIKKWTSETRVCSICGVEKSSTLFDRNTTFCKECRREKRRNYMRSIPEKVADWNRTKIRRPDLGIEKRCAICEQTKPIEQFDFQNREKGYRCSYCRDCRRQYTKSYRESNREEWRKYQREYAKKRRVNKLDSVRGHELTKRCKKYGITVEWWTVQLAKQNNVCALCLKAEISEHCKGGTVRSLAIDHHHENGTARGLLCSACNQAVGKIEGSPGWLDRAAEYLKQQ
jgi:hypothetical protein